MRSNLDFWQNAHFVSRPKVVSDVICRILANYFNTAIFGRVLWTFFTLMILEKNQDFSRFWVILIHNTLKRKEEWFGVYHQCCKSRLARSRLPRSRFFSLHHSMHAHPMLASEGMGEDAPRVQPLWWCYYDFITINEHYYNSHAFRATKQAIWLTKHTDSVKGVDNAICSTNIWVSIGLSAWIWWVCEDIEREPNHKNCP